MKSILFTAIFSLLLIHEMDAIRTKEWKMFIILKDMAEEAAYKVFAILHWPLYFIALYIMVNGGRNTNLVLEIMLDVFLVIHSIIHFYFRRHKNNGFKSVFSNIIIYSMTILSIFHLYLLFFGGSFSANISNWLNMV